MESALILRKRVGVNGARILTVPTMGTCEMTGVGSSPAGTWRPKNAMGLVADMIDEVFEMEGDLGGG